MNRNALSWNRHRVEFRISMFY